MSCLKFLSREMNHVLFSDKKCWLMYRPNFNCLVFQESVWISEITHHRKFLHIHEHPKLISNLYSYFNNQFHWKQQKRVCDRWALHLQLWNNAVSLSIELCLFQCYIILGLLYQSIQISVSFQKCWNTLHLAWTIRFNLHLAEING